MPHSRVAASKARRIFADLLDEVSGRGMRVVLHRHGKDVAVLVSPDDLSRLEDFESRCDVESARAEREESDERMTWGALRRLLRSLPPRWEDEDGNLRDLPGTLLDDWMFDISGGNLSSLLAELEDGGFLDDNAATSDSILLVEGESDKEYFELLRDPAHGAQCLTTRVDIVPYGGTGALRNTAFLRIVKNRCRGFFLTFDLDAIDDIENTLKPLQLERGRDYLPVGLEAAGKQNIEGLLPESVARSVYSSHPNLVQAATNGTKEEQGEAKRQLKKLLLQEFKAQAQPGEAFYGHFYALVRVINKALDN